MKKPLIALVLLIVVILFTLICNMEKINYQTSVDSIIIDSNMPDTLIFDDGSKLIFGRENKVERLLK